MQGGGPQGGGGGGICHNFQNGSCKYGANCRFVHPGQATAGPSGGGFQGRGGGGGNQNFGGGGGGFNKGGFGGSFGGGGGNRYGGGGGNQQQGGGGNRFNNQNQGQGGGGGNQFGNQRRHGPRVNSNTLCNFFLQGKCTRGNTCQNIHQYSVDYDIQGEEFADLKKIYSTNKINVISMDIYEVSLENNQIAVILCTLSQLALVLLPSGQKVDLPVPEGNLTAFHYDRNNKLIFLGYLSTKSNKGGIKIYKDNGGGEFQEIANAPDLHPKEIMGIQTQIVMDNMLLLTAGKDDHLKAWVIQNDGKFELIASGIATDPIYNIICANDCIFAGCGSGKVEVFRLSGNAKEFERFKEFDVHSDSNSIITRVIGTEDCIYAASYCGGNNGSVGQVGFISCTNPEKISHLVSLPLPAGAITLEHMPIADIIFIGYDNGTLEFRDKDGFIEKGKAFIHKNPIRDIKQINDLFLVVDETGLFTLWKILDEKAAEQKKQEYKQQQQQQGFGGGFGGNSFSGGFGGGGSFNQGGGGGFNTGGFGGGGGNMFSGGNNTMGDGFGMSGGGQMGNF